MLRAAGLIAGERRGTCVYYRVLPGALRQVSALVVMAEIGIDLSCEFLEGLTADAVRVADVVITMGCGDA